jgi:hypothetical protein
MLILLSFSDRRNTVLRKSVLQYLYLLIVSTNDFYDGYWVVGVLAGSDLEAGNTVERSAVKFCFFCWAVVDGWMVGCAKQNRRSFLG